MGLAGTQGSALEGERLTLHRAGFPAERIDGSTSGGGGADPMAFPHDYHRGVIDDFVDAVEKRREPRVNGEEALRVHRLIDALLAAGATGKPVKVTAGSG